MPTSEFDLPFERRPNTNEPAQRYAIALEYIAAQLWHIRRAVGEISGQ
jgi:hypothetical protein